MKKIALNSFYLLACFFVSLSMEAQDSELTPDELIFNSTSPSFINAHYGLDGITLQNFFDYMRLEPDTLRVGDDLRFSILDGDKLAINTALTVPGKFTFLDLDRLTFRTKGTGLSVEEWQLGRSTDLSNPPVSTFRIMKYNVGIGGGAAISTGLAITSTMNVGIGTASPTQKLDVDGNARFRAVTAGIVTSLLGITADGTLTTVFVSDRRLKENVSGLRDALNKTLALRGVTYHWKADENKERRIGLIAQEVEEVIPELVFRNETDGYLGVRYHEISALLIEAMKEQQKLIEELQREIIELKRITAEISKQTSVSMSSAKN